MYYRVEIQTFPDEINGIGYDIEGWQGVFRPGGFYYELLERGARDYEASSRLRQYCWEELPIPPPLPPGDESFEYQFWFTEQGYRAFEKMADIFLEALSHMPEAKDMRVLTSDLASKDVFYEDLYQVAVRA